MSRYNKINDTVSDGCFVQCVSHYIFSLLLPHETEIRFMSFFHLALQVVQPPKMQ